MDDDNLRNVLNIINEWWQNEIIPESQLQARTVLIFKKDNTKNLANYRPISLLQSISNICAGMIQNRFADGFDETKLETAILI